MKRTRRKNLMMIMISFLLVWSLIPWWNMPQQVDAAAKYFYFTDLQRLQDSTVDNPFIYTSSTIDLAGTFNEVNSDTLKIKVEQIYQKSDSTYDVVEGQFYIRDMINPTANQFEVNGVELFAGINRLTLFGIKNGVTLEDEFYILYDNAPYLFDLTIQTGSDEPSPLNAGTGNVVTSAEAYLEGTAPNAEKIVVNNQYTVQPLDDGTFFSPVITLSPGKNTVTVEVIGKNDSFTVERTVYYFNSINLIFEGDMYFDVDNPSDGIPDVSSTQPVIGSWPTFAVPFGADVAGRFEGKIMVPYNSIGFDPSYFDSMELDGDPLRITNVNISNPQTIRYGSNNAITYEIYDLIFDVTADTLANRDHTIAITTSYSGITGQDQIMFTFANSNENIVENVFWLYDYPTDPNKKEPLDGARISESSIYVEVDKNKNFDPADILRVYLTPYDPNNTLAITQISTNADTAIYKIDNIPPGNHTIVFNFDGTPSVYDFLAHAVYVSGAHALFTNVFDGMTIDYDDRPNQIRTIISGVSDTYDPAASAVFYVNNVIVANAFANYLGPDQEFVIDISGNPLEYGENRIKLEMTVDGYVIIKEIKIFVSDDKLPSINIMKPVLPPVSGTRPDIASSTDRKTMYEDMTGLILQNDVYYTTATKYDLLMEVSNFEKFRLLYDGTDIIDYDKVVDGPPTTGFPTQTSDPNNAGTDNKNISIDYNSLTDTLYVRVEGIEFDAPGSQIFTLRIQSDTGSQATKRMEIVREVVPFEVLSPVPTSGTDIIVNKNFVNVKIKAEGADQVIIGKEEATKLPDSVCEDCFEYEYLGLKPGKWTTIKFSVIRGDNEIEDSIDVFYANTNVKGAQYKEPLKSRHRIFNNALQLEFDRDILMQTARTVNNNLNGLYENQRILFGIADPETGVVEEVTDEGITKSPRDIVVRRFSRYPDNFTFISPIYWIDGGLAEVGVPSSADYKSRLHGIAPHQEDLSLTYTRRDQNRKLVPTKRGELTIQYDDFVRESAGTQVTVFYFDENGDWVNLGGIIDERKRSITVPFDEFGYYAVAKLRYSFNDVKRHPWAMDILEALYAKGFMKNVRFDEFGGDDYITRGEFAQLMVRALQLPLIDDDRNSFIDVQPGSRYGDLWEYRYIETAARAGIVQGLDNRIFGPNQRLTREQAAVMIARAMEYKLPANNEKLLDSLRKEFTDYSDINYYARPAVITIVKEKIMIGKENVTTGNENNKPTYRFDPNANLTRAEAAAVAVRIMQNELKYFPKNLN